jgi:hypothetical protein
MGLMPSLELKHGSVTWSVLLVYLKTGVGIHMSDKPIDYEAVLKDLKARRDKLTQIIELMEGTPDFILSALTNPVIAPKTGAVSIRPGEFYGMTILDATRKFLAKSVGEPKSAPQIVEALQQGGYVFTSELPVNTVASLLSREEAKGGDIVRVGRGIFGLAEWYPGRARRKKGIMETAMEPREEGSDLV